MKDNNALLAGFAVACLTIVACVWLMSSCARHADEELTKRQAVAGTNAAPKYEPPL